MKVGPLERPNCMLKLFHSTLRTFKILEGRKSLTSSPLSLLLKSIAKKPVMIPHKM